MGSYSSMHHTINTNPPSKKFCLMSYTFPTLASSPSLRDIGPLHSSAQGCPQSSEQSPAVLPQDFGPRLVLHVMSSMTVSLPSLLPPGLWSTVLANRAIPALDYGAQASGCSSSECNMSWLYVDMNSVKYL